MAFHQHGTSVQSIRAPQARELEKYSIDVSRVRLNLRQGPCFTLYVSRAVRLAGHLASANSSVRRGHVVVTRVIPRSPGRSHLMSALRPAQPEARRPEDLPDGQRASSRSDARTLITHQIGALPILQSILTRMNLGSILEEHLSPAGHGQVMGHDRVVLLLIYNLLIAREPMYGVVEWARNFGPEWFGIWSEDWEHLNDDRIGRCLEAVHERLTSPLILRVVARVVEEFQLKLEELHNDSTTVTFHGDYPETRRRRKNRRPAPEITWGHNKDHRPDLKQLLYTLTITEDGGVPIYFETSSGNVTDDTTHATTWMLMAELVQRPDFVYVADCKLASTSNLDLIARQGGRFITVLPATRKEDSAFRQRLKDTPETIHWELIDSWEKDEEHEQSEEICVCREECLSKEGYRLLWFRSRRKARQDRETRIRQIQRAIVELESLRARVTGPRSRFRERKQIEQQVEKLLDEQKVAEFLQVEVTEKTEETFRQASRGRPSAQTRYEKLTVTRFDLTWSVDNVALERVARGDGVFPLITNLRDWTPLRILQAYKRQPFIEKRFSQFKSDFSVAPVFLKSTHRIAGLLAVYFLALMTQALLERELRQAMKHRRLKHLPLYPEGRACARPTARQVIDTFSPVARHTLVGPNDELVEYHTELSPIHHQILDLLGMKARNMIK
jgi:transposase